MAIFQRCLIFRPYSSHPSCFKNVFCGIFWTAVQSRFMLCLCLCSLFKSRIVPFFFLNDPDFSNRQVSFNDPVWICVNISLWYLLICSSSSCIFYKVEIRPQGLIRLRLNILWQGYFMSNVNVPHIAASNVEHDGSCICKWCWIWYYD